METTSTTEVSQSVSASDEITRKSASNLAMAFVLLPEPKRRAMSTLYAFCREIDDIADDESIPAAARREQLAVWRSAVLGACHGRAPKIPVIRELQPYIERHKLPFHLFDDLIRGVEMDLSHSRYPDVAELEQYCYRVASVVGLLSIEIFEYRNPRCRDYAIALGQALQWTNILRDVGNDAARGRVYLPRTELDAAGVTEEEILAGHKSDRFQVLARRIGDRARGYFGRAAGLLPPEDRSSMVAAELMGSVYWNLLMTLEKRGFPVLQEKPIKLSRARKLLLVLKAWTKIKFGFASANYGR